MYVCIYTEKIELIKDNFNEIVLPSGDGQITILNNHNPILGVLTPGKIILKKQKSDHMINISVDKGFFYFKDNHLTIIVTHTKLTYNELEKIKESAIKLAEQKIIKENISEQEFKKMKDTTLF